MAFNPARWYSTVSDIIKNSDPTIDTSLGTMLGDTFMFPTMVLYEKNDILGQLLLKITNLDDLVDAINDTEFLADAAVALESTPSLVQAQLVAILENIAADYGLARLPANYANGIAYYVIQTQATENDYDGVYSIPTTNRIQSIFNIGYSPIQDTTVTINHSNPNQLISQYYVATLGAYAIPVQVQADTLGTVGNIEASQILFNNMPSASRFSYATNLAAFGGGRLVETDAQLAARIKKIWQGTNMGTVGGYLNFITNSGYGESCVLTTDSPLFERDRLAGNVDIYLRDSLTATFSKAFTNVLGSSPTPIRTIIDTSAGDPNVLPVSSVDGILTGTFTPDTSSVYAYSTNANDAVANIPSPTTLTFTYNSKIADLWALFQQPENKVIGQNVLIRAAKAVPLNMEFKIAVRQGYNAATVKQDAYTSVLNYVNALLMGSTVTMSDIVGVVEAVDGVDFVYVPFYKFYSTDPLTFIQILTVPVHSYIYVQSLNII